MNLHTIVLRQTLNTWAALCLENSIVGQGETQDHAIENSKKRSNPFNSPMNLNPTSTLPSPHSRTPRISNRRSDRPDRQMRKSSDHEAWSNRGLIAPASTALWKI